VRPFVRRWATTCSTLSFAATEAPSLPADFKSIDGIPHALLYGADGALKFQGHPLRTLHSTRISECNCYQRRRLANAAAETPLAFVQFFCKPLTCRGWTASALPIHSAQSPRQTALASTSAGRCAHLDRISKRKVHKGRDDGDEQDSGTIRNHMMATEVLRNCPDPVWSTLSFSMPLILSMAMILESFQTGKRCSQCSTMCAPSTLHPLPPQNIF